METGKRQMDVEELFRQKLENAEVIPGASVHGDLMRKLSGKEFLRFNPARFNIYYLALIAAGVITAGLLLFSEPRPGKNEIERPVQEETSSLPAMESKSPQISTAVEKSSAVSTSIQETRTNKVSGAEVAEVVPIQRSEETFLPSGITGPGTKEIVVSEKTEPVTLQAKSSSNPALFSPSATSGCAPLKVTFTNYGGEYSKYSWTFGDGGTSDRMEPVWIYDEEGDYKVTLNATDTGGRSFTWSAAVKVYPQPKAHFEISPEKAVLPIDEIRFVNYSSAATDYIWEFGDGTSSTAFEPMHKYLKFGKYDVRLIALSENGCTDTLLVKNAFSGSEYFISMPNAFIPNPLGPSGGLYSVKSDETAEIFHPDYSGVTDYQLRIFSKTGIPLFESNDISIGWDGYFKGQLCNPGVYVWKIRGNFSNGEPFTRMGDVTLLKK